ncbi:2-succinyl-6-hydroxy-2,4-cyclohexadiene-1-carboxylate synthase [Alteribacillus iranensis]|uniref:Putative 2-succinyl-6-hydroxy-2,4-cyclohexadiene-1-carboxylate synthase n=1 Tax=Alteribacillus iranensis TaxID=930128 RepID=A0A1I2A0R9_9BACI|nr:2-succinyl-6-hydroxy-2,4-cyclohexadiene-1-carboxylate synthase [Alteribacillus iranensis]SFE37208.1 2-succinyl-6-hydroxy-2,4-cyclohexadiene-1-carboxylate synthase [Alteribacillus iranensis]
MNVDCGDVTYHIQVAGEGEALLLLHGFTGSGQTWEYLIDDLKEDYFVIMVDIIGHGQSDHPRDVRKYDIKRVAGDIKAILHDLNFSSAHVLGYSMGGRLALTLACLYPEIVRSLILESASPGLKTREEREKRRHHDKKLANEISDKGISAFIKKWENIPLFASQNKLPVEQKQAIRSQRLKNTEVGLANSLLGMGTGAQPSWWDFLPRLNMQVLLITGELDVKFCEIARAMAREINSVKWVTVNDTGHTIHVESPQKFGTIVKEFLLSNHTNNT